MIAALSAATFGSVQAGDVTGTISFEGTAPNEIPIPLDPLCGRLHPGGKLTTSFYKVTDGKLGDVFVYVTEGLPAGKTYDKPSTDAVLDQKNCVYVPYILGAQTGQTIRVKNSDALLHNVHPTPMVKPNKEYNKAQLPKGPDLTFSWDTPEVFLRFKCDVHPWMFAYVGLVDHPFHAVAGDDGSFKISGLPAGEYTIEAYHRKLGKQTAKVKVTDAGGKADFTFKAP